MDGLIEALPIERREAYALRLLETDRDPFNAEHPALAVLQACQHIWSVELGYAVLVSLRRYVTRQRAVEWRLHSLISLLGSNLPVDLLEEAGRYHKRWPEHREIDQPRRENGDPERCTDIPPERDLAGHHPGEPCGHGTLGGVQVEGHGRPDAKSGYRQVTHDLRSVAPDRDLREEP